MSDAVILAKAIRDTFTTREKSFVVGEGRTFGHYTKHYEEAYDEVGGPAVYKGLVVAMLQAGYCDFHEWAASVLSNAKDQA
jgi:hypothetical protein